MKKLVNEIKQSFKAKPLWTLYSLALAPLFYGLLFLTAATLSLITFSVSDGVAFWRNVG